MNGRLCMAGLPSVSVTSAEVSLVVRKSDVPADGRSSGAREAPAVFLFYTEGNGEDPLEIQS